jgi:hypothetical protein
MTVQAISWVLDESESEGRARCTAIALANRFDAKEPLKCWPGIPTIAKEAKTSDRTAQRCLDELVALGELIVVRNAGGDPGLRADRRPNLYLLPTLIDADRLTRLLADFDADSIQAATCWLHCLPPRTLVPAAGCQPVTPPEPHGVTEPTPRGDRTAVHGVTENASRGDTAVIQNDIDPTVENPLPSENGRPRRRQADPLWDSVLAACGLTGSKPTASARGAWNRAVKELRDLEVAPDDVDLRARLFRSRWPGATLTPSALARRWPELASRPVVAPGVPFDADLEPDPLYRAQQAIAYMPAEARALYDERHLVEGALACLQQNPDVHVSDLAIAAEFYAEQRAPAGV